MRSLFLLHKNLNRFLTNEYQDKTGENHSMDMIMKSVKVFGETRNDLYDALKKISKFDDDITGKSGLEFLWQQTWELNGYSGFDEWKIKGKTKLAYPNNFKYIEHILDSCQSDEECVNNFFRIWMENDCCYGNHYHALEKQGNRITKIFFSVEIKE